MGTVAAMAEDGYGYNAAAATASELTEEMDSFLDHTESEFISDDDDPISEATTTEEEIRMVLKQKDSQIKSLRKQLMRAKHIMSRTKSTNKAVNKELKDVMYEIMTLNEQNKSLTMALQLFAQKEGFAIPEQTLSACAKRMSPALKPARA